MPAPTLLSMAQRACIRDIAGLEDVGEMSYELVEPILRKITNPNQLRKIEIASPHLGDHTAELWKAFIARDIPQWQDKSIEPRNPCSWWKVYRKLIRQEQHAKEESEQQLMAAMQGIQQEKEANKMNIVHKVLSEPVRSRPLFADGIRNPYVNNNGGFKAGTFKRPSLKNAKSGRDIMHALRKQSTTAAKERNLGVHRSAQPAGAMILSPRMQITQAPKNLVRAHQQLQLTPAARQMTSEQTTRPTPKIFASTSVPSRADREIAEALREKSAKDEDRLRALTSAKSATPLPRPSAAPRPSAPATTSSVSPSRSTTKAGQNTSPAPTSNTTAKVSKPATPDPAPPIVRKRPAPSIFMPSKKRKV